MWVPHLPLWQRRRDLHQYLVTPPVQLLLLAVVVVEAQQLFNRLEEMAGLVVAVVLLHLLVLLAGLAIPQA